MFNGFFNLKLKAWLEAHLKKGFNPSFLATLWWSWRWRNDSTLGDNDWTPHKVLQNITSYVTDMRVVFNLDSHAIEPIPREVQWTRPAIGSIKVNVDGSRSKNPSRAGFGGLLRDNVGDWIFGFSGFLGDRDILFAELASIKAGLLAAWQLNYRDVSVETDSIEAWRLVTSPHQPFHLCGSLLANIKSLLGRLWKVEVVHILREANYCADMMAKIGLDQSGAMRSWITPLAELHNLLVFFYSRSGAFEVLVAVFCCFAFCFVSLFTKKKDTINMCYIIEPYLKIKINYDDL